MDFKLSQNEDFNIQTKGGGRVIVPNVVAEPQFNPTSAYAVDEKVWYGAVQYICTTATTEPAEGQSNPTPEEDSAHWAALPVEEMAKKSEVDTLIPLLFAQYYPDGSVKSAAEFTAGIKYDDPDTTNRMITVKPFCDTGTASNDNSSLVGRVVIPPFVDAQNNPYISDDGTRYRVVGIGVGVDSPGNNSVLKSIIAPTTVLNIGGDSFRKCISLASAYFPEVTSIGSSAFRTCSLLETAFVPKAQIVRDYAFRSCSVLKEIYLPVCYSIDQYAFNQCSALTAVDFGSEVRASVPTMSNVNAFSDVPNTCKIIVPDAQYDAWIAATNWSDLYAAGYEFLKQSEWEYARKYETVPTSRTVNGQPLTSDVVLTAENIKMQSSGNMWVKTAVDNRLMSSFVAPAFKTGQSYTAGTKVVYGSEVYEFTQDKAAGNWNSSVVKLLNVDDIVRYSLVTKTISSNAVTLDDRACNYVDARALGSSDSIDIDFPALVDGKSRDFVLAVECGANPPTISYAAFVTIMAEGASSLTPEEGMNIYSFMEFKTNMFLASRKLVATVVDNSPESGDQLLLAMQKRGISTTGITDFGGVETALGLGDTDTPQDAIDAVMN